MGAGLALAVGLPTVTAPLASAAPAAAPATAAATTAATVKVRTPHVTLKRSATKQISKVSSIRLKVRATSRGKAVSGTVRVTVSGKHARTLKLHHGVATLKLTKKLTAGRRTVKVVVDPTSAALRKVVRRTHVRVVSQHQAIVAIAKKYVGVRYVSGGRTPRGFDCSGFTSYVYKKAVGKKLSRTSSGQRHNGHVVSRRSAQPGDIIWTAGHVAIYLGGNRQIDAPRPGKSIHVRAIWQSHPTFIRAV